VKAEYCQGESRAQKGHPRAPKTSLKSCPASKKCSQREQNDVEESGSTVLH
jgi:hypothetical protein